MIGYEATIRDLREQLATKDEENRQLREALGSDKYDPVALLGLRGQTRVCVTTLLRVSPERVSVVRMATALTVSDGHVRHDPVSHSGVKVAMHKARTALRMIDIEIENIFGEGWRLDEANAARLRAAIEGKRK